MTKDTKTVRLGRLPSASAARSGRGTALRTRVAALGIAAALGTGTVLATVSAAWLSSTIALALVVFAPTSTRLDRRLALNLALAVGWAPAALLLPPSWAPAPRWWRSSPWRAARQPPRGWHGAPRSCPTGNPGMSRWSWRAPSPRSSRSPCGPQAVPHGRSRCSRRASTTPSSSRCTSTGGSALASPLSPRVRTTAASATTRSGSIRCSPCWPRRYSVKWAGLRKSWCATPSWSGWSSSPSRCCSRRHCCRRSHAPPRGSSSSPGSW